MPSVNLAELVPVGRARHNHAAAAVLSNAYTQLIASTDKDSAVVEIVDDSGEDLIVAIGYSGSEVDQIYTHKSGEPVFRNWKIPAGSRVSVKVAQAGNSTLTGSLVMNLYG